jgi:hypothetical protein
MVAWCYRLKYRPREYPLDTADLALSNSRSSSFLASSKAPIVTLRSPPQAPFGRVYVRLKLIRFGGRFGIAPRDHSGKDSWLGPGSGALRDA